MRIEHPHTSGTYEVREHWRIQQSICSGGGGGGQDIWVTVRQAGHEESLQMKSVRVGIIRDFCRIFVLVHQNWYFCTK